MGKDNKVEVSYNSIGGYWEDNAGNRYHPKKSEDGTIGIMHPVLLNNHAITAFYPLGESSPPVFIGIHPDKGYNVADYNDALWQVSNGPTSVKASQKSGEVTIKLKYLEEAKFSVTVNYNDMENYDIRKELEAFTKEYGIVNNHEIKFTLDELTLTGTPQSLQSFFKAVKETAGVVNSQIEAYFTYEYDNTTEKKE